MRRQLNKLGKNKMTTLKDFEKKGFINNDGKIESMTYGEYCREYGGDETTSPRGIAPRIHIREDEISEGVTEYQLWSWGVSGNNPYKLDTYESEEEAELALMKSFEYYAINKNDNAPQFFNTEEEVIDNIIEAIMSIDDITREEAMDIYFDGLNEEVARKRNIAETSKQISEEKRKIFETYKNIIPKIEGESYKETSTRLSKALAENKISGSVFHMIIKYVREFGRDAKYYETDGFNKCPHCGKND